MSTPNFWGNLIQQLREEQCISQRQLASRAKVNRSTLRRIEDGEARGDIDTMERLLNYLGYELEAMTSESLEARLKERSRQAADPNERSKIAFNSLLAMDLRLV